jgi:hypothetical protein
LAATTRGIRDAGIVEMAPRVPLYNEVLATSLLLYHYYVIVANTQTTHAHVPFLGLVDNPQYMSPL